MLNTLLFIHLVIAVLLVIVILLQKTSTDGLSGIGGGNNMGIVSSRSAATFMTRTTIILGVIFFANALVLANLSSKSHDSSITDKLESIEEETKQTNLEEGEALPMAK